MYKKASDAIRRLLLMLALLAAILPQKLFAQSENTLNLAAEAIQTNSVGDPINNGRNANGAKFGNWYYQDVNGKRFFCQEFVNGDLKNEKILLDGRQFLVKPSNASQTKELDAKISHLLREKNIQLNTEKGCAFVCGGAMPVIYAAIPFGSWTQTELEIIQSAFQSTNLSALTHVEIIWK